MIEHRNKFLIDNHISLGAQNSVEVIYYSDTLTCFEKLKNNGYSIVATTPHKNSYDLAELPLEHKLAIAFGTEEIGLSEIALEQSELFLKIPMYGFTESLNISVSLSIVLFNLIQRLQLLL